MAITLRNKFWQKLKSRFSSMAQIDYDLSTEEEKTLLLNKGSEIKEQLELAGYGWMWDSLVGYHVPKYRRKDDRELYQTIGLVHIIHKHLAKEEKENEDK